MKTLHFSLIMFTVIIFLGFGLQPVHADDANGISIQNINVQPVVVKVGNTFTVTATLVNNSTVPIVVESGTCVPIIEHVPFFTVILDNHTKIKAKNLNCAGVGLSQILNPRKNIIGTSPDSTLVYIATESGTANVTVAFSYYVKNQKDTTQPNIEQTISKSFLFTIYDNSTGSKPVYETVLSPLKQFKSGIAANDVKCKQDLQLVIKTEDGLPACVKLEHLIRLSQYGWTIPDLKIIGDTDTTNNDRLSETNCGQFHTIPENKSDSNEIPVLILKQNSTGCAKITFTVNFLFNNTNDCVGCNSQMVKTAEFLRIGKYNFSRHGDLISGSGKDYTNSFQIASVPQTVDVSKYPIGSNFTVIFMIKPLPNATGFYDYSIVKPVCNAYPLAVGYSSDQVNSSDFSEDLSFMQNHSCVMGSYGYSQIQVSGMDYVQMKLN